MKTAFTLSRVLSVAAAIVTIVLCTNTAYAGTYTWKGTTSTDWNTASNWSPSGVPTSIDIVNIGSTTFTNQPTISSSETAYAASITFGTSKTATLTLNGSLTVPGNITMASSTTFSMSNTSVLTLGGNFSSGTLKFPSSSTARIIMNGTAAQYFPQTTTLSGNVGYLDIQNTYYGSLTNRGVELLNQASGSSVTINYLYVEPHAIFNANATLVEGTGYHATIGLDAIYVSHSTFNLHDNDNIDPTATLEFTAPNQVINLVKPNATNTNIPPNVIFTGANITVNGGTAPDNTTVFQVLGNFGVMNTTNSVTFDPQLTAINIGDNFIGNGAMYSGSLPINITGSWLNTANYNVGGVVTYNGSNAADSTQVVATSVTYQNNVVFTGATPKQVAAGTMSIAGNVDNSAGTNVDFVTNASTVLLNGSGTQYIKGGTATNSYYPNNVVTGTIFNNVTVATTGAGAKTILQGNNSISPLGVLTVNNPASLDATGANSLTFLSDATGSGSFGALPLGAGISGSAINVQRFIKGSYPNDLSKRGYRLMSSTIHTATVGGNYVFDLGWLAAKAIITGPTGGGFFSVGNPSTYIYREDILPSDVNYTTGDYKGVASINNTPAYNIGTQKWKTLSNICDTTVTLTVGNGVLFFFRGNKTTPNGSTSGTKTSLPYNYPEDVTFTNTGTLNTGTVNVKLWYKQNNYLGYTNSPSLANAAVRGYCLVGNPYASAINWEKYNRNSTVANSSIYGADTLSSTIYLFNPTNKQYEAYMQKTGAISTADTTTNIDPGTAVGSATNMIASGQGFFVRASAPIQTLSFRETAKTPAQPSASKLNLTMARLMNINTADEPLIRLQMLADSINTDEIVVRLNNTASTVYSNKEDAADMGGISAEVSLSALSSDSVQLCISRLPFPEKAAPQNVPLYVNAISSGQYQLKLTQLANLGPIYEVWLKDRLNNDSVDMHPGTVYSFNIDLANPATFGSNRFQLVIDQNPALALRLLSFDAAKANDNSLITWKVKGEYNTTGFYIERSTDKGETFQTIGSQQSTGAGSYNLVDKDPVTGENQYQLKLLDINSNISYSNIVTLFYTTDKKNTASNISIYPNPSTSVINLTIDPSSLTNMAKNNYSIKIVNSFGMVVKEGKSQQSTWHAGVGDLLPGTYQVQVTSNNNKSLVGTTSFVKN